MTAPPLNGSAVTNGALKVASDPLWEHPNPRSTQMWKLLRIINEKHGLNLRTYQQLHQWSVESIAAFWEHIWEFVGIRASVPYEKTVNYFHQQSRQTVHSILKAYSTVVVSEDAVMFPPPVFFPGAKLNFAENLLYPTAEVDPDSIAIIAATEVSRETITWRVLRDRVRECQASLKSLDLKEGERVAGYVANHTNALVAMLAVTSLGAVWTAVSPDTGVHAVLERLRQIEVAVLFADNAAYYNGKSHPTIPKVAEIAAELPSLRATVIFPTVASVPIDTANIKLKSGSVYDYRSFEALGSPNARLSFNQLSSEHPVYILYSSGTTGAPKCIVHGAIGTLIQHKKEHIIHCSIGPGSRLFYFTTCTWMMWHWLVSGLASGATVVLYDGSPFRYTPSPDHSLGANATASSVSDDLAVLRLIDEVKITHFGTSAKYLSILEQKNVFPKKHLSLDTLEAIYSTGSPLAPSTFRWIYSAFPPRVNLGSITGGTDIISLFGAPNPLVPVYVGEIQAPGLGMAIRAFDFTGKDITSTGEPGDLVCIKPFPCEPVGFWGKDGERKYKGSYFEKFEGLWHHGDFVKFNPNTGGLIMLGRSDGILKPAGVRFGSAEIYNVLLAHFSEEVSDSLCVGRRRETDTDETVVLFLKMAEGQQFTPELATGIMEVIRKELSARHVPGIIDACPEIPVTTNGKKVEGAVKQILSGMNVKTSASVANADCLDWYREWTKSHA